MRAPLCAAKRTASDAFGDNSYDQLEASSLSGMGGQLSSPSLQRVPLNVLQQAPLRSHLFDETRFVHGEPQPISKPVWRHEKARSPLNISKGHRSHALREPFDRTRRPHNPAARFPLEYTPVRASASQSRAATHLEARPQILLMATSKFSYQPSSPTTKSQHRVPLSSRPAARAPTSSSSGISTRRSAQPSGNIHTNEVQPFLFKRPETPSAAKCSHPSIAASGFRAPPPIPLH
jgi:hypothetical protein